jgi:uncharacterized protein YcbK (DUF882 family)
VAIVGVSGQLTPHFHANEFRCPHCGIALVRPDLTRALELLRVAVGKPIPIVSGFRCTVHNASIGGATNSQHMYGAACDIPSGIVTLATARKLFHGVGTKGAWAVHLDVRDGAFTTWKY